MTPAPPANLRSDFMRHLLAHNRSHLDGFRHWLFYPGMEFNSPVTWWGRGQPRPQTHEGLDLCWFGDCEGRVRRLPPQLKVPATFAGVVLKIAADFLGQSIFLVHEEITAGDRRLLTAYGHTAPLDSLQVGRRVAAGDIIATLGDLPGKDPAVSPHLHLSFAWVSPDLPPHRLHWPELGRDPAITLIDPLPVIT
jgi:hypothetical protein